MATSKSDLDRVTAIFEAASAEKAEILLQIAQRIVKAKSRPNNKAKQPPRPRTAAVAAPAATE